MYWNSIYDSNLFSERWKTKNNNEQYITARAPDHMNRMIWNKVRHAITIGCELTTTMRQSVWFVCSQIETKSFSLRLRKHYHCISSISFWYSNWSFFFWYYFVISKMFEWNCVRFFNVLCAGILLIFQFKWSVSFLVSLALFFPFKYGTKASERKN